MEIKYRDKQGSLVKVKFGKISREGVRICTEEEYLNSINLYGQFLSRHSEEKKGIPTQGIRVYSNSRRQSSMRTIGEFFENIDYKHSKQELITKAVAKAEDNKFSAKELIDYLESKIS